MERMGILVYPFENTGDKKFSWLSAGMTDTVISDLARYRDISVITDEDRKKALKEIANGQTGVFDEATIAQIGKMNGANLILRGSYLVSGDSIRVNARVIDIESGTSSNPVKIDGTIKGIFDLQDKIVVKLLEDSESLTNLKVNQEGVAKTNPEDTIKPEAFELYSKGLEVHDTNPTLALEYYKKAIQLEPNYIKALEGAGSVTRTFNLFSESIGYYEKAEKIYKNHKETNTDGYGYATLMNNIGFVYKAKGNKQQARVYYEKAKSIYQKLGRYDDAKKMENNINGL